MFITFSKLFLKKKGKLMKAGVEPLLITLLVCGKQNELRKSPFANLGNKVTIFCSSKAFLLVKFSFSLYTLDVKVLRIVCFCFLYFQQHSSGTIEAHRQKAVFRLSNRVIQAVRNSCLDKNSLKLYLQGLSQQYQNDMNNLSEE